MLGINYLIVIHRIDREDPKGGMALTYDAGTEAREAVYKLECLLEGYRNQGFQVTAMGPHQYRAWKRHSFPVVELDVWLEGRIPEGLVN